MSSLIINSAASLVRAQDQLERDYMEHRFLRLSVKPGFDRSLDQNAISHAWYNDASKQLKDQTPEEIKCECKLRFGVPILRAEDADFREMYDAAIKHNLNYEQKLKAMRFIPVTSLMNKQQMSRYLEHMQQDFAKRGVNLEFPMENAA